MPKFFESKVHFFPKKSLAHKKCSQSGNSLVQAQGCPFQAKWKLNFNRFQAQNPRPAGGGGRLNVPPLRFFEDSKKTAARSAAGFSPTLPPSFPQLLWNFDPMPCEVRSPGQVKWPNYKITFQSRHGYNVSGTVMKLSEYDEVISAYKTYISDFWYRWPQVRSILRPPHYKSMGKKSTLLYLLWRKRFWVESYRIGQLWTIREKNCITYPSKGHLRSS